jgi:kynurenine formamidase
VGHGDLRGRPMCIPGTFEAVSGERHHHQHLTRRDFFRAGGAAGAAMALAAALPTPALAADSPAPRRLVDLTHVLTDGFPVYPAFANPRRVTLVRTEDPPFYAYANQWTFAEHSGTHLDVPAHFFANGRTVEQIPLEELILPAVVVDISDRVANDPDAMVGVSDLRDFEAAVGRIPEGAAVLMRSGWDRRIGDQARFLNFGPDGHMHTPGWSAEATDWLLTNRDVRCLGVDSLTLDPTNSIEFPVHRLLLGEDRLGLEILTRLEKLPPIGATVVIGVVPFEKGSGAPGRIFALV